MATQPYGGSAPLAVPSSVYALNRKYRHAPHSPKSPVSPPPRPRRYGAALLAAVSTSPSGAAPGSYEPGEYTFVIKNACITDIQGTIEPGQTCAEVYGGLDVHVPDAQGAAVNKRQYFLADSDKAVDVCEENRPLNEGKQADDLPYNQGAGQFELTQNFTGEQGEWGFVIDAWLMDYDTNEDDKICTGSSPEIHSYRQAYGAVWSCDGDDGVKFTVEYSVRPAADSAGLGLEGPLAGL
ncbi:hypothetical protein ACFYW1_04560 [Streptomyces sp. NPDC002669]|uniref:hypothetical protein n=1 Tax=Streptomyces sp. NPDC002669 TaxID=3364658 RepID=UPI0036C7A5A0